MGDVKLFEVGEVAKAGDAGETVRLDGENFETGER